MRFLKRLCLVFLIGLVMTELVDVKFYRKEHQNVLDICRKSSECSIKLATLNESNQEDLLKKYRLLESYYEKYWSLVSCLSENKPCGKSWGNCCSGLECQYVLAVNDDPDEPPIGLCSLPNVTYSMP